MGDLYSECIVKRETPKYTMAVKLLIMLLMLASVGLIIYTWNFLFFIAAIVLGIVFYFYSTSVEVEYEYAFVNGEVDFDKITNKAKRRRELAFDFARLEIMAPAESHHLDGYKNKTCKLYDFTSANPENADKVYVMYGTEKNEMIKIMFEPDEKMLTDMKNNAPRKVNTVK
ncbi:MAG: hypothetical protein IJW18_03310 [Lachnospiraceae bacterium]|nr:hypothetical protein [Lachnospiraceae bacterium]